MINLNNNQFFTCILSLSLHLLCNGKSERDAKGKFSTQIEKDEIKLDNNEKWKTK